MATQFPTFSAATPQFFAVVLHNTLREERLLIPRKFVWQHGKTLSSHVLVKLPCGSEWKMELKKSDDQGLVWLSDGWQEFAKHYFLKLGHFLVFSYQGNSRFNAFIFDKTTVEIDYPIVVVPSHSDESNADETEDNDGDDVSVEIVEEFPRCSRPQKKLRTNPIGQTESDFSHPRVTRNRSNADKPENSLANIGNLPHSKLEVKGKSTVPKRRKHFRRADGFEFEEPTFTVVMKPIHVIVHRLVLPPSFSRKFLANKSSDAILKLSDGRSWPMKILRRSNGKTSLRFQILGWTKFSQDNNLKLGDICTFKLIDRETMSFNVLISRASDDSPNHHSDASRSGTDSLKRKRIVKSTIHDDTNLFRTDQIKKRRSTNSFEAHSERQTDGVPSSPRKLLPPNPFFKVELQSLYRLHVPQSFSRIHCPRKTRDVTLQVENNTWPVRMIAYPDRHFISAGWRAFMKENNLRPGDTCVFELASQQDDNVVLKLSTSRSI